MGHRKGIFTSDKMKLQKTLIERVGLKVQYLILYYPRWKNRVTDDGRHEVAQRLYRGHPQQRILGMSSEPRKPAVGCIPEGKPHARPNRAGRNPKQVPKRTIVALMATVRTCSEKTFFQIRAREDCRYHTLSSGNISVTKHPLSHETIYRYWYQETDQN